MPANQYEIVKYQDGAYARVWDTVVEERRVKIFVNGRGYISVMATPKQLDFLAVGYLFTEGVIGGIADIVDVRVDGLTVRVEIVGAVPELPLRARSCGFGLGSVAVRDIEGPARAKADSKPIGAELIVKLMEKFNQMSPLFRQTGAVHSAWLLKGEGAYFAEDVGRHNALDKVIGQYLSAGAAPAPGTGLIFTTGRISTEMLLKTVRAGMDALISRGSASRLAVDLAEQYNLILIGFARGERFKAFCGGQHLIVGGSR